MRRFARTLSVLILLAPSAGVMAQDSPEELLAAASALFDAKRYDRAAERLDKFFATAPDHPKAGIAALALGQSRMELKQYPQAVAAYERAAASKDANVQNIAFVRLGEAAMAARQYQKAAAALDNAVKRPLKPEQAPYVWAMLGQANYELGLLAAQDQARAAEAQKRFADAEQAFNRVIAEFNKSEVIDSAFYGAALAALRQKKYDVARKHFRTVVEQFAKSPDRVNAQLFLAQLDLDEKKYKEARSGFEGLLGTKDVPAEVARAAEEGLIQTLLESGDHKAATPLLEKALAKLEASDPMRFRAFLSLGHCRYNLKEYQPALTAYIDASKSQDAAVSADALYWAANSCMALKQPAEAAVHFSAVVAKYPKSELAPRAQLRAGEALEEAKSLEKAAAAYRAVLDKYADTPQAEEARKLLIGMPDFIADPAVLTAVLNQIPAESRAPGTMRLARLYMDAKKYPEAISAVAAYTKDSRPEVASEAQYLTGIALEVQQKPKEAVAAFAESVRLQPAALWSPDANSRLAWLYLDLKQPPAAEKAAQAALAGLTALPPVKAENPDQQKALEAQRKTADEQIRLALIQSYLDQQKWDPALAAADAVLKLNPATDVSARVLFTQAWVNEQKKQPEAALPIWERIAAEHPRNEVAADALYYIGLARAKAEKWDEAAEKFRAIITGFPKHPRAVSAHFELGTVLYTTNKFTDAAAEFDAVAASPDSGELAAEAVYFSGASFRKAQKNKDAIERFDRFVKNYANHPRAKDARQHLAALKALEDN